MLPRVGLRRSFVYRIRLDTLRIDRAYRVGAGAEGRGDTRDGRYVLVSNWCSYDLSVISTRQGRQVRRIPIGAYPRGIAVSPTKDAAYVAEMGGTDVVRVDLRTGRRGRLRIGAGPRALVVGPAGRFLFATLNAEGRVARLDLRTGRRREGRDRAAAPRSLAIAPDGRALYVVNYESGTVSKVRASDMRVLQSLPRLPPPDRHHLRAGHRRVWVACYGGSIAVYDDR